MFKSQLTIQLGTFSAQSNRKNLFYHHSFFSRLIDKHKLHTNITLNIEHSTVLSTT
jgi:hypothetical protein